MSAMLPGLRRRAASLAASEAGRGMMLSLVLKVGGSALNIGMLTLLARAMSQQGFGVFALWFNALGFLAVFAGCGQEKLIQRSWHEYLAAGRPDLARGVLLFGIRSTIAGSALISLGLVAYGWFARVDPLLIGAACAFLLMQSLYTYILHATRAVAGIGKSDPHDLTWRLVVIAGVSVAMLAATGFTASVFLLLASLGLAIAIAFQLRTMAARIPGGFRGKASPDSLAWIRRSLSMGAAGILEAASQYIDVILVGLILSPAVAGGYFVASRLANSFAMITGGFNSFTTRQIARLHYGEGRAAVAETLRKIGLVTLALVACGAVAVVAGGPFILRLFGQAYLDQYPILVVLSLGTAFVALSGPAPAVLLVTGHEAAYSLLSAIAMAIRCIVFVVLAWRFGAMGAAIASALSAVLTALALNIACRRLAAVDPAVTFLLPGFSRVS